MTGFTDDISNIYDQLSDLRRLVRAMGDDMAGIKASMASQPAAEPEPFHETQSTISQWQVATFGVPTDRWRYIARLAEEMAELLVQVTNSETNADAIAEECADCWIVACGIATMMSVNLEQATNDSSERAMSVDLDLPWARAYAAEMLPHLHGLLRHFNTPATAPRHLGAIGRYLKIVAGRLRGAESPLSLSAAVDAKMRINRARRWNLTGDGHGYHVKGYDPGDEHHAVACVPV